MRRTRFPRPRCATAWRWPSPIISTSANPRVRNSPNKPSGNERCAFARAGWRIDIRSPLRLQHTDDIGVGPGLAEQEALCLVAALGAQPAQLGFGFDTLGGDGDA